MADTITVTCPECETTIKASAAMAGKKVRCKSCGGVFVAQARSAGAIKPASKPAAKAASKPAAKAAPAPVPEEPVKQKKAYEEDEDDGKPIGLTEQDLTPRCPHCANEMESETAKVCLHCGYNTETRAHARMRKVQDVTGGDIFLWLLPGILCVLGIIFLLVWDILYCNNIGEWVDPESWYGGLLGSGAVKMWMCMITAFVMAGLLRFAIKRLIVDNKPPEVELKEVGNK